MRRYLPDTNTFTGQSLPQNPAITIGDHIDSGQNGHVFHAHSTVTDYQYACKIVPAENLPTSEHDKQLWLQEAKKANRLQHPSVVPCIDAHLWDTPDGHTPCAVFLYPYVAGPSLRQHLRNTHPDPILVTFIEAFMHTMLGLLHELQHLGMDHGDLHAGNVIVASPSELDIEPQTSFRVIDFGVLHLTGLPGHHADTLGLAHMLRDLLDRVNYQAVRHRDRYVFNVMRSDFLSRYLIETDPLASASPPTPRTLFQRLRQIDSEYALRAAPEQSSGMLTPFDYPNCEQMGHSHSLLNSLYSKRFLGLREIEARNNLVLTGPRGCGKTTVFLALSLHHRILVNDHSLSFISYIGIYYRCDDLYFTFPRFVAPTRSDAVDVPMHFIVATLLTSLLDTVRAWSTHEFPEEFQDCERRVAQKLWDLLDWPHPLPPTLSPFDAIASRLQTERKRAADKARFLHDPKQTFSRYFGPRTLVDACHIVREQCPQLATLPIYFFIDDYSEPKITLPLQENLNRLFMHRSAACFFKLSTESPISFSTRDFDGKAYVEAREYTLVNLGLRYIKDGGPETLPFLEDLFERRFQQVPDYPVRTLEQLIGTSPRNENDIARRIASIQPPKTYYGTETLAALCSGDIHYMIRLVERMVEECGGVDGLRRTVAQPRIDFTKQHDVIRAAAGDFFASVRMLPEIGEHLADVIAAFGSVARSFLMHRKSKNQKGHPPHQASRIEPYESLGLSDGAQVIRKALLRYSIFLEDPRGKSRRGHVVPRLFLRRYLIPHFNLTFSQRDSIALENRDVELLLTEPKRFEEMKRARAERGELPPGLFGESQ